MSKKYKLVLEETERECMDKEKESYKIAAMHFAEKMDAYVLSVLRDEEKAENRMKGK
jgi:hypothetical protein